MKPRGYRLILPIALICLLAACFNNYQGFPAQLRENECVPGDRTTDFPLKVRWCLKLDLPISDAPKAKNGIVYVRTSDNLSRAKFLAIDAKTSAILWEFDALAAMGEPFYHWNVVDDYVVISGSSRVFALNRRTGQPVWQKNISATSGEIVAVNQELYVVTTGSLYHINTSDGEVLWESKGLPSHRTFRAFYIPGNATIVIPADDYYVVDAASGRLSNKGSYDFLAGDRSAVPYQTRLIYGSAVVDAATGKIAANLPNGDAGLVPLVISNAVYYITDLSELVSRDLGTQQANWIYSTDAKFKFPPGRVYISAPVAFGKELYILTNDDKLRAILLETGHELGQWYGPKSSETLRPKEGDNYVPSPGLTSSADGLYASFGTNLLYAFEAR